MDSARLLASTGTGSALEGGVDDWWTGDFVRTLGMGGVSYCGVNPGRDQRFSMEAPPNFQLDSGQTRVRDANHPCRMFVNEIIDRNVSAARQTATTTV
jgi:hypothetical protein